MKKCLLFLLIILFAFPALAQTTKKKKSSRTFKKQPLTESCDNPAFPSADPTPPDSVCPAQGSGGAEAAQNTAKNDFCSSGDPQSISFEDFKNLQNQVADDPNINWGDKNTDTRQKGPTTDRTPLQQLGEGNLVVLRGFVLKARQEGAESVNCGSFVPNQAPYHDIHIAIVPSADETDECNGIVAEMSPHHRPDAWTAGNVNKLATSHTPVRLTGHLFFDSSHVPCSDGQGAPGNPKRFSLWEIHPIYQLEVCTANCDAEGTWVNLVDWVNSNQ
ncbi:MAG TPA: hypothetical protein VJA94_20230 [Candidatus Angelobacter sp.]